jgi:Pentapeptide repeats (9 copies)
MDAITIPKGLLAGKDLRPWEAADLLQFAQSDETELKNVSLFQKTVERGVFRSVRFQDCNFARTEFRETTFRKCVFERVDLTRTTFRECVFSDCRFINSDPYHATFPGSVIAPSSFKKCFKSSDLNKALILFLDLKRELEESGDHRGSRAADYYYRRWERNLLHHRWRNRQIFGIGPWLWSLFLGSLTGYGERPQYLLLWTIGLITASSFIYRFVYPACVSLADQRFLGYWYFSFKVFCGKGFTTDALSRALVTFQVIEFTLGMVFLALLVGSITRKLS